MLDQHFTLPLKKEENNSKQTLNWLLQALTPAKPPTQHFGCRGPSEKLESPYGQPWPKAEPLRSPTLEPAKTSPETVLDLPRLHTKQTWVPSMTLAPPHPHPQWSPAQDLGGSQLSSSPSAPEPSRSVPGEHGETAGPDAGHRPLPPSQAWLHGGPGC